MTVMSHRTEGEIRKLVKRVFRGKWIALNAYIIKEALKSVT